MSGLCAVCTARRFSRCSNIDGVHPQPSVWKRPLSVALTMRPSILWSGFSITPAPCYSLRFDGCGQVESVCQPGSAGGRALSLAPAPVPVPFFVLESGSKIDPEQLSPAAATCPVLPMKAAVGTVLCHLPILKSRLPKSQANAWIGAKPLTASGLPIRTGSAAWTIKRRAAGGWLFVGCAIAFGGVEMRWPIRVARPPRCTCGQRGGTHRRRAVRDHR